jgi:hypothetical protein
MECCIFLEKEIMIYIVNTLRIHTKLLEKLIRNFFESLLSVLKVTFYRHAFSM